VKLTDIIKATKGTLLQGNPKKEIKAFSIDSRTLKRRDLFIAIKGTKFNGHNFIKEATRKGAAGILVSKAPKYKLSDSIAIIKVKDTTKALGDIARYKRIKSKATVIAVTGSNGKTTTKDMIASILKRRFSVLSTKDTENNNIGLPLTLLRLKHEKFCVLEMGMNHPGEIDYLAGIARPDVGVINNIGPCHLEHLKDLEGVFKAKMELLKHMKKNSTLVVNGDDPYLSRIKKASLRIIRFGLGEENQTKATSVTFKGGRPVFAINDGYRIQMNILGRHNMYNALAAISVAGLFGLKAKDINYALENFKPTYRRLDLKNINGVSIIDDTYNSNPSSLSQAVSVLASYRIRGKKILVSGDMMELGEMSKYFHEAVADMVKDSGIDMLITVGKLSYDAHLIAKKKGMNKNHLRHFSKAKKAGHFLRSVAEKGDLVLVKGSRAMKMEEAIRCFTTFSTR